MTNISYAKEFEDIILWNVFKDIQHGFYIDIGASHPEINSVTKNFYDNDWTGINIEPSYQFFYKYLDARPNDINLNIAIGNKKSDKIEFYEILDTEFSTLDKTVVDNYKYFQNKNTFNHKVISKTLTEVCIENNIKNINFLKINSNGNDIVVIEGIDFNIVKPWVIAINSQNNQETKQDIDNLLVKNNYKLALKSGNNDFYLSNDYEGLTENFIDPIYLIKNIKITKNHQLVASLQQELNTLENKINDRIFITEQFFSLSYKNILNSLVNILDSIKCFVIKIGLFCKRVLRFFYRRLIKNIFFKKKDSCANNN
tara:strand:- start:2292 stop:3230 length:939 start_codon:yes stop_codon:yes gene_type:complete